MHNSPATPLTYFPSHVQGAKNMSVIREAIANNGTAIENFHAGNEERDKFLALLDSVSEPLIVKSLNQTIAALKASDAEARKATFITGCRLARGISNALEETYCKPQNYAHLSAEDCEKMLATFRKLAEFAANFLPHNA